MRRTDHSRRRVVARPLPVDLADGEQAWTFQDLTLQRALEVSDPGEIDGFAPNQRFFLAWAQAWRRNYRDEALKLQVNTDPHSPGKFRTIGPLANMPEFAAAFGCEQDDAMVRVAELRADIW